MRRATIVSVFLLVLLSGIIVFAMIMSTRGTYHQSNRPLSGSPSTIGTSNHPRSAAASSAGAGNAPGTPDHPGEPTVLKNLGLAVYEGLPYQCRRMLKSDAFNAKFYPSDRKVLIARGPPSANYATLCIQVKS